MKKLIIPFVALILILILDGFFVNSKSFKIVENSINIANLPQSFDGFKVLQISDLLLGSTKSTEDLEKIVKKSNELKPDIIVFTGDLISNDYKLNDDELKIVKESFKSLECNLYKYAIIGDNDAKQIDVYKEVMNYADFTILDNESTYLFYKDNIPIKISGVTNMSDIEKSLSHLDNLETCMNLVLTHYPDLIDSLSAYDIDVVLAGHSLKGQIRIPFYGGIMKKDNARIHLDGYYKVNDTSLYVSGGLGSEVFQFRLFNKPELNLYRFYSNVN